jgi:hypothetical protein
MALSEVRVGHSDGVPLAVVRRQTDPSQIRTDVFYQLAD